MGTALHISRLISIFATAALFIPSASAQFWDSWSNTYSPTWTPLSLDQMTTKKDSSYKINTYQSTASGTTTTTRTPPPADLLIPEGGKGIQISKNGVLRYLDDYSVLPFGSKSSFDTKEITFLKDRITFKVGTITHYNAGADSFGYVHPERFTIDTKQYRAVSDAVKAPDNFTVPEGAIGVRIKEWGDDVAGIQYLNNNMRVSGAKSDYANAKILNAIDPKTEIGEITIDNFKQYDNVDSFGYIYPTKLQYAFYMNNGKDEFGLPLPPKDYTVPEGTLGVRIGDWGNVYYLKDAALVSPTAFGKLADYTYDAATQEMVPATKFNIVDFEAGGREKEIGAITHYIQDADIYSYGYVFAPAENQPPTENTRELPVEIPPQADTPQPAAALLPFNDVAPNAKYAQAVTYAVQNNWIEASAEFKPKSKITYCEVAELLSRASGKSAPGIKASLCNKKIRRKAFRSLLKKVTVQEAASLLTKPKRFIRKWEAVSAAYEILAKK